MNDPLDVLAVMAHPDDAELLCGGALAKCADAGQRTGIVDLTQGEAATLGSPEIRAREAAAAAAVLGLAERRNAGLPDTRLESTHENRRVLVALIRELRPRIVITHFVRGRHPDHRRAAELVYDACFLAGLRGFDADGQAHRPDKVVHALAFREDAVRPTFVVDVTRQMDRKLEAVACYTSQFAGALQAGEVFPGDRPLEEQIRAHAAAAGSRIRVAYGEPFWTRETVAVESVGSLGVASY